MKTFRQRISLPCVWSWMGPRSRIGPALVGRELLVEVVFQHRVVHDQLVVQPDAHAVALHHDAEVVPFAERLVGQHERVLAGRALLIVPESARALRLPEFHGLRVVLREVPDLHLRHAAQVDAAVALRQHLVINEQLEVAVVLLGREVEALAVVHEFAVLHLPVRVHVLLGDLLGLRVDLVHAAAFDGLLLVLRELLRRHRRRMSRGSFVPQPNQPERSLPLKSAVKPAGGTLSAAKEMPDERGERGGGGGAVFMWGEGCRDAFRQFGFPRNDRKNQPSLLLASTITASSAALKSLMPVSGMMTTFVFPPHRSVIRRNRPRKFSRISMVSCLRSIWSSRRASVFSSVRKEGCIGEDRQKIGSRSQCNPERISPRKWRKGRELDSRVRFGSVGEKRFEKGRALIFGRESVRLTSFQHPARADRPVPPTHFLPEWFTLAILRALPMRQPESLNLYMQQSLLEDTGSPDEPSRLRHPRHRGHSGGACRSAHASKTPAPCTLLPSHAPRKRARSDASTGGSLIATLCLWNTRSNSAGRRGSLDRMGN